MLSSGPTQPPGNPGWVSIDDGVAKMPNGEPAEWSDIAQCPMHVLTTDGVSSHPVKMWNFHVVHFILRRRVLASITKRHGLGVLTKSGH